MRLNDCILCVPIYCSLPGLLQQNGQYQNIGRKYLLYVPHPFVSFTVFYAPVMPASIKPSPHFLSCGEGFHRGNTERAIFPRIYL